MKELFASLFVIALLADPGSAIASRAAQQGVQQEERDLVFSFRGILRSLDKKEIVIEPSPDNQISFVRTKKTRFFRNKKEVPASQIHTGDHVVVDATQQLNGDLDVVRVTVEAIP